MRPSITPRLLAELNKITNNLTSSENYDLSEGKSVQHNAKAALARENIYNLISEVNADVYAQIVQAYCSSNNAEICLILDGADPEKILALPNEQLTDLTFSLSRTMTNSSVDIEEQTCIQHFFDRLKFQKDVINVNKF